MYDVKLSYSTNMCQPPEIEILSISDASLPHDAFGAAISIVYDGNASIQLETVVQVNRINGTASHHSSRTLKRIGILCAQRQLNVPIKLTISQIKLAGILVIDKSKDSLDVRFSNDPIKSVQITSTFDSLPPAQKVVKRVVEGRLRDFLLVHLPLISQKMHAPLLFLDNFTKQNHEFRKS